jgi:hypothetical protein
MISRFVAPARFVAAVSLGKSVMLVALMFLTLDSAQALDLAVGPKQVIYTKSQRSSKGLGTWPDGNLGVVSNGKGGYEFYGPNGSSPVKTTGSLTDPAQSKSSVKITGLPKSTYSYVSGGPVYRDEASGARVMIYHAEKAGKKAADFHSVLGMAVATDAAGLNFRDLGTIVEPNLQSGATEVGGGSFAILGSYFDVYYRDKAASGASSELAVARAPVADLISNALSGRATSFTKYYNGSWSQPGRGGLASPLEVGNPGNSWSGVSYNDYLNQLVMVSAQSAPGGEDLYLATSADGVNWSPRQAIALDAGEQFYPSLVGTGPDPQHTGQSFYVYYTDSQKGAWNRWQDAQLARRSITINPFVPPVVVTPPPTPITPPTPTLADWATISDYRANFQAGSPATGWKYDWNPSGKLGNFAAFAPLLWSNAAQAYNTTGGATTIYNGKSHNDDYLELSASGGHPGLPKYMPIAGYTIQAGDGAGLYRIANSTISKADGSVTGTEDGLQVLVYVNNLQIGGGHSVLTNGQLANFDLTLGQLKVGDTVWVMVDPLKNQLYDAFGKFNFAVQKSVPYVQLLQAATLLPAPTVPNSVPVPEPGSASLLVVGLAGFFLWHGGSRRR